MYGGPPFALSVMEVSARPLSAGSKLSRPLRSLGEDRPRESWGGVPQTEYPARRRSEETVNDFQAQAVADMGPDHCGSKLGHGGSLCQARHRRG